DGDVLAVEAFDGLLDPGVEGRKRRHDQKSINLPKMAFGFVERIGHGRLAGAGHGKVGAVWQDQELAEVTDLEFSKGAGEARAEQPVFDLLGGQGDDTLAHAVERRSFL